MQSHNKHINFGILLLTAIWLSRYFFLDQIPNVDLDANFAAGERLWQNFRENGSIQFYDPFWFGGYPAFYFYGWLAHFLAGIFYALLGTFTDFSYSDSARFFLLLNLIILPANLYFLSTKFFTAEFPHKTPSAWLAFASGTLAFWFINISDSSGGAGLAGAIHSGMFSQAIAWNILISVSAFLLSSACKLNVRDLVAHTILSAALILCHPLTAAFYFALCPLYSILRFKSLRFPLFSLSAAALLTSPWWLNFFKYSQYLVPESSTNKGNLINLLLGTNNPNSFSALLNNPLNFNFSYLLILLLLILVVIYRHKASLLWIFSLLLLTLGIEQITVLKEIGLAIHIYRFTTLAALLTLPAIAVILYNFIGKQSLSRNFRLKKVLAILILMLSATGSAINTPAEYNYSVTTESRLRYRQELQLLEKIRQLPYPKRIFQEYFNDYSIFTFVSPHYLSAALNLLNIETLNGLYIQSSLANRQAAEAAAMLGVDFYGNYVSKIPDISAGIKLLEDLGTTHLILTNPALINKLKSEFQLETQSFGPYALIKLNNPAGIIRCQSAKCLSIAPQANWTDNYQILELTNLTPDSQYIINYNYFPTITCEGCLAEQGDLEKIIIRKNEHTARLKFK